MKYTYKDITVLNDILLKTLKGQKFKLDCGHCVTIGHNLGTDLVIRNHQTKLTIVCLDCGT